MVTAEWHDATELQARAFCKTVCNRFGGLQVEAGLPRWNVTVMESECQVHGHILGPLPLSYVERLLEYSFEGMPFRLRIKVRPVVRMVGLLGHGLFPGYLGKELGDNCPLGEGGGEKVRPSADLRRELLEHGLIEARPRKYTSRALSHFAGQKDDADTATAFGPVISAAVADPAPTPAAAASVPVLRVVIDNAPALGPGQLSLFPERQVTRLRNYMGGHMSRSVAHEVETRRRWLNLTQAALAAAIGLSRPQLANALRDAFGLSPSAAARLRAFLLHGEHAAVAPPPVTRSRSAVPQLEGNGHLPLFEAAA